MSPGVIITAFVVSLLLVFGNKSDSSAKDKKTAQTASSGPMIFTSVEELAELLDDSEDAEVVIVKSRSKRSES